MPPSAKVKPLRLPKSGLSTLMQINEFIYLYIYHAPSDIAFVHDIIYFPKALMRRNVQIACANAKNRINRAYPQVREWKKEDQKVEIHVDPKTLNSIITSADFIDYIKQGGSYRCEDGIISTGLNGPFCGITVVRHQDRITS